MERKGWGSALTPLGASRGGWRLGRALAAPFPRLGRVPRLKETNGRQTSRQSNLKEAPCSACSPLLEPATD